MALPQIVLPLPHPAKLFEPALTHLGLLKQTSPYDSFYALQATDADGESVDFGSFRNKVVLLVNVPAAHDAASEGMYEDMRLLLDTFAARPGEPFALVLLPCDQFPNFGAQLRERVRWLRRRAPFGEPRNSLSSPHSSQDGGDGGDADAAAALAVQRAAAAHGLTGPALRILARADVNGPNAHPVWTFLKASYGDTSDIGWNFGKFIVGRDGLVHSRISPPLRIALLAHAIEKLMAEVPRAPAPAPGGAVQRAPSQQAAGAQQTQAAAAPPPTAGAS